MLLVEVYRSSSSWISGSVVDVDVMVEVSVVVVGSPVVVVVGSPVVVVR